MPNRLKQIIDFKNFLLIGSILVAATLIGVIIPYFVHEHRQAALKAEQKAGPASTNQTGKLVKVAYTNKGFNPKAITVPVGTTVSWTNESDKQMWIGSDPHPAHNGLPGFDQTGPHNHENSFFQKSGLAREAQAHSGGHTVYRYTFAKAGTWPYHNHLSPNDKGKVTVE